MAAKTDVTLAAAARLLADRNYGLAIETYRRLLAVDPENARAVQGLATAYDRLQRYDLSDRYFQLALALAPRDADIYDAYAASLRIQGRTTDAALLDTDKRVMLAGDPLNENRERQGAQGQSVAVLEVPQTVAAGNAAVPAAAPITEPTRTARLERSSVSEVRLFLPFGISTLSYGVRTEPSKSSAPPAAAFPVAPPPAPLAVQPTAPPATSVPGAAQRRVLPTKVINASGAQGIARRMKSFLNNRGWAELDVGDSMARLGCSRIIFPVGSGDEARRLARALPFRTQLYALSQANRVQLLVGGNALALDARLKRRK
ncbi:LytR C-terminal domain-containing protein [Sphingomonas panacisoli]|nr:LytR C-terminal domain-containing protein [Sphingomonas panacisoli]